MMRRYLGADVVPTRSSPGVRRPGQWLPRREASWYIAYGPFLLSVRYRRWGGLFLSRLVRLVGKDAASETVFPNLWSVKMKQLSIGGEPGKALPPLPSDSVVLKKFPRLMEFLTHTTYDNGAPRAPGRLWLDSDLIAFTLTLFEPSAFARVRIRAASLDDLLTLAEKHLGSDNPAWEDDQYARERAAEKKKKK